jgi:thiamine-phosphate pyrophosphorylase
MTQIYLISPPQIELDKFSKELEIILKTGLVPIFQLRLKDQDYFFVKNSAIKLNKICQDYNTKFIINDNLELALEIGCNGVHLGIDDRQNSTNQIVKIIQNNKNFTISFSCYDSKDLAIQADNLGASFISFGAFFPTKTKISPGKPTLEIIDWAKKNLKAKIIAIGGINSQNSHQLISTQLDYIALISFIWQHPKGSLFAINEISQLLLKNNQ